jgi:hypothetical protein
MQTTTRRGIQYPSSDRSDRADIALHIGNVATAVDADVLFNQGTDAARIAAAHQTGGGRFWWTTDTHIMWYDDGTNWSTVGSIAAGTITSSLIQDGTIVDADIAVAAGILISKLAGFPNDASKALMGNGAWAVPVMGSVNQRTASYTLTLADNNALVEMNVAAANQVTVPPDSTASFPLGSEITIAQLGAGQTQLVAGSGVTLRGYNNNFRLAGQNAVAAVIKRAANDWYAAGNLVP